MRRIIDHKRIELTDDEWKYYESICKSYDRPNFKGAELFHDLFETDENGVIIFLKPPKNYTSMEVFLFLMSVMMHQHLRVMYTRVDEACAQMNEKTKRMDDFIQKIQSGKDVG